MHTIEKILWTTVRYVECIAIINNKEFTDRNSSFSVLTMLVCARPVKIPNRKPKCSSLHDIMEAYDKPGLALINHRKISRHVKLWSTLCSDVNMIKFLRPRLRPRPLPTRPRPRPLEVNKGTDETLDTHYD